MSSVAVILDSWDRRSVAPFIDRLRQDGWNVVIEDPITPEAGDISDAVTQTGCAVVIWSAATVTTDAFRKIAEAALRRGRLISAAINGAEPPPPFAELGYLTLPDDPYGPEAIGDAEEALSAAVRSVAGWPAPAGQPSTADETAWRAIENAADASEYKRFAATYPESLFAVPAQHRAHQIETWGATEFPAIAEHSRGVLPLLLGGVILAGVIAAGAWYWNQPPEPEPAIYEAAPEEVTPEEAAPKPEPFEVPPPKPATRPAPFDTAPAKKDESFAPPPSPASCINLDETVCFFTRGCKWSDALKICYPSDPIAPQRNSAPPPAPKPKTKISACFGLDKTRCFFTKDCEWSDSLKFCFKALQKR